MRITMNVPNHPLALNGALEGLVRVSAAELLALLMRGHKIPTLYTSGIRYQEEPRGQEFWGAVADNLKELKRAQKRGDTQTRHIDCEDLAGHLAGQLRVVPAVAMGVENAVEQYGAPAIIAGCLYPALAVCKRTGRRTYHAIVEHPDGTIEDPSRALGMTPKRRP